MPSTTLKHLPQESVAQLSHLLQILPSETDPKGPNSYYTRLSSSLRSIPSDLKAKSRLSALFTHNPPCPPLCLLHKPLSIALIHELFTLLALEVGAHTNSLIGHNTWLTPLQNTAVQQLRELHSLWLPEDVYRATFLCAPNAKWPYQGSTACEGCVLTRIGSDLEIVGKLAMLLMSRRRTVKPRPGHPKLLEFVEWWVRGLMGRNEAMGREVLKGSKMEGEELKIVRKRIWRERREKAREVKKREKDGRSEYADVTKGKEKEMVEDEMANEGYNSDFENEIVDHYAKLRSTLYVPDGTVFQPSPASTPSLTTGSSAKTQSTVLEFDEVPKPNSLMPEPLQWNKPHQPPGSSRYSVNQGPVESAYEPPRRGAAWQARQSAGSQAKEYRNMLTPLMEKPSPRSNPFKDPSVNEVSRHQPTMAAPREALSRAKTVKQPSRYGVSEHHPHAAASSLVRSKTVKEEKRRQTRWAEFSTSGDENNTVPVYFQETPRPGFVGNIKNMLVNQIQIRTVIPRRNLQIARTQMERQKVIARQNLKKKSWYLLSRGVSLVWDTPGPKPKRAIIR